MTAQVTQDGILHLDSFKWAGTNAKAVGGFERLPAGAYVCRIAKLEFQTRQNGDILCVVDVDVAEGKYAAHFANRARTQGAWPFVAQFKRYVYRANEDAFQSTFKGFVDFLKQQNPNAKISEDGKLDPREFRDLICGFTFGEEEYLGNDGSVKVSCKVKYPCDVEKVRAGKVKTPELVKLAEEQRPTNFSHDDFSGTPIDDDDFPFV